MPLLPLTSELQGESQIEESDVVFEPAMVYSVIIPVCVIKSCIGVGKPVCCQEITANHAREFTADAELIACCESYSTIYFMEKVSVPFTAFICPFLIVHIPDAEREEQSLIPVAPQGPVCDVGAYAVQMCLIRQACHA